jgi:hypothetical protein
MYFYTTNVTPLLTRHNHLCAKITRECWTDFHEIWCGRYATVDFSKLTLYNFLQIALTARWMLKAVRWNDDDVITHDTLHMRITDLTQPDYQV